MTDPNLSIPTFQPGPPSPKRPNTGLLVGIAAAIAVVIAGVAVATTLLVTGHSGTSSPKGGKTFTVSGNITLTDSYERFTNAADSACEGFQGYADIQPGAQVVVFDAAGKTVGVANLGDGRMYNDACSLPFEVAGVPAGAGPYSVEVSHRGKIAFTESTATDLALTLGS